MYYDGPIMAGFGQNSAIVHALDLMNAGDVLGAGLVCRQILERDTRNHQAMVLLGQVQSKQGGHRQAAEHLARAVALAPKNLDYHLKLGEVLAAGGRNREALLRFDKALKLKPNASSALAGKSSVYVRMRDWDKARRLLAPFVDAGKEDIAMAIIYAKVAIHDADYPAAVEVASRHLTDDAIWPIRQSLWFEIGAAHEKAGQYDEAFEAFTRGNTTNPAAPDPSAVSAWFDRLISTFDRETMRTLPRSSITSELAVPIVGIYRSGSTLVEQIIDAHPQAHGAGELLDLPEVIAGMSEQIGSTLTFPECIEDLEPADVDALGNAYLDRLRGHAPSAARICDKQLPNFERLGILAAMLPRARVIHTRRDPLDTCVSCYVNRFAAGTPSYLGDLRALGMYYNDYLALMEHWRQVLDVPMFELDYEELVQDQEGVTRRLLEFCGLEWDDRCLRFFESKREVLTLSREQVNQPIYRGSVGHHQRYARHLGPLREVLASGLRGSVAR